MDNNFNNEYPQYTNYLRAVIKEMYHVGLTQEQMNKDLLTITEYIMFGYTNHITPIQIVEAYLT